MRRKTTAVRIGNVVLSSEEPVLVQSMLNTSTREVDACVEQAIRIIEAGGRLVRITAPGVKEAEMLGEIHRRLRERGYTTPISADIHFVAEAASVAARYVEKVRINPGNFADKRATFKKLTYTDEEYAAELEILRQKFTEFLEVCRQYGTAVRIGTNHGSLSDRIMSRYGDTPAGMVEATMEYLRVCQACDFKDVVISLKSSDCRTMVDAVRLLVEKMEAEGMCYPLHLGVTEAGEGEDGRIRSAVGIGTLLNEGIGDTIRVSLTEEPEAEIPVACELARICSEPEYLKGWTPLKGECSKPCIVAGLTGVTVLDEQVMNRIGFTVNEVNDPVYGDRLHAGIKAPEWIYTGTLGPELTKLPPDTGVIVPLEILDMAHVYNRNASPLCSVGAYKKGEQTIDSKYRLVQICRSEELDAEEGDGQIDGHFDQSMPAGLLERAFKLNGLVVDAFAALQYGLEGKEQQQEGVDVVGVLNAAGVDADDRQQKGRRHGVAERDKGQIQRLAQVEQAKEPLPVGVEDLAHPERDAVEEQVHHEDDLDEEHVVDAVDADELEIAEVGQQHHVRVVEDNAGQLVHQHRVLLGDGGVIRFGVVVDPGVVLVGVPQDDRDGQHGAQAVQQLHGQNVLGEHQHQHLADAGDQGGGGLQIAEHIAAAVHIHQQPVLAMHKKAGDRGQAVQDGV